MKINELISGKWSIFEVDGDDSFINFLNSLDDNKASGIASLLEKVAYDPLGPRCLPTKLCHAVVNGHDIWQFSKSNYRILWFYDEGKTIICTHAFIKTSQKTPKREQKRATDLKKLYFEAKESGKLEIEYSEE